LRCGRSEGKVFLQNILFRQVFAIVKVTVMVTDGERVRFVPPGDVRGWDWYAYVENNPLRYSD